MKEYAVFVYGTLRPGNRLYGMIRDSLVIPPIPALLEDHDLYSNHGGSYPYMVESRHGGTVLGEVLLCNEGRQLDRVVQMELGCGYDLRAVEPMIRVRGKEQTVKAFGFVLPRKNMYLCGPYVRGGDWNAWTRPDLSAGEVESIPVTPCVPNPSTIK